MEEQNFISDSVTFDGAKLWDEILKAIVSAMPTQLFPLFKEIYGREYQKDSSIVVLGSETSSFQEDNSKSPTSTFMDIALLVAGTDYYHLECQMKNEDEIVIRMFAYDVRFAITHTKAVDRDTGEITLYFPYSVVIYPEKNDALPDTLTCRVVFQDSSEHIYKIPTVRIQTYSLKEIKEKHLLLFIPYTILRLRPKLGPDRKKPLTKKELTEFVREAILVLKEEYDEGNLTEREYQDYVRLFQFAANRVLTRHPQMNKEVWRMTEPMIKLPKTPEEAVLFDLKFKKYWMKQIIVGYEAEIEEQKSEIADQKSELAEKDAEIQRLQKLVDQLSVGAHMS